MNIFLLEQTEDGPLVKLDPNHGHMLISGRSFMEDATVYFNAIIDWFRTYMHNPKPSNLVEFELEYVNSASHAMIVRLLEEINKYYIMGHNFEIMWRYHSDDESIRDMGMEIEEMFDIPINYHILA